MTILEPGTGSPVVELLFNVLVVLFFGGLAVLIGRTMFLLSLLWIMPVAKVLSFVPAVRRWIERKTRETAV